MSQLERLADGFSRKVQLLPLPDQLKRFVETQPVVSLGIAIAGAILLVTQASKLRDIFLLLLVIGFVLFHYGSFFWLLHQRSKSGAGMGVGAGCLCFFFLFAFPIPFVPHLILYSGLKPGVKRGASLATVRGLQRILTTRQQKVQNPQYPLIEIGGVSLPNDLENLSYFFLGAPGSGKSQAIKKVLSILRQRSDFRVIVLDRNAELLESFYDEGTDLIFNPRDQRSVKWGHLSEAQQAETMAAAMVPESASDEGRFFAEAARSLLADLYERCRDNAQVWEVISQYSHDDLKAFVKGGLSTRIFDGERMTASVLATMVNNLRFYRDLEPTGDFSFSRWAKYDSPEWLFLPIFEDTAERYKPVYSAGFELAMRGLLSTEKRQMKTAIVIDELGALNRLASLNRLTAESRKFGGTLILGTQTDAQIDRVYGEHDSRIILQGTATKLILNCRDGKTAERCAGLIGRQERVDITRSNSGGVINNSRTEQIREIYVVMPTELQILPPLQGYLSIADGTPPAKVQIEPQSYPGQAEKLIEKATVHPWETEQARTLLEGSWEDENR